MSATDDSRGIRHAALAGNLAGEILQQEIERRRLILRKAARATQSIGIPAQRGYGGRWLSLGLRPTRDVGGRPSGVDRKEPRHRLSPEPCFRHNTAPRNIKVMCGVKRLPGQAQSQESTTNSAREQIPLRQCVPIDTHDG